MNLKCLILGHDYEGVMFEVSSRFKERVGTFVTYRTYDVCLRKGCQKTTPFREFEVQQTIHVPGLKELFKDAQNASQKSSSSPTS